MRLRTSRCSSHATKGRFQAWLRLILTNKLRDVARQIKRRPARRPDRHRDPDLDIRRSNAPSAAQNQERFEAALKRLSPEDQQAIFARCELRISYEEVAELLGKPTPNAARARRDGPMIRLAKEMSRERYKP